jgi:uncharacterized phiE125 gp8 family phage protein
MALTLVTAPTTEPITTADAKAHLRVDISDDDDLIDALVIAARRRVEHVTWRALLTQTWKVVLDAFPADDELRIPRPPLQEIDSIKYTPKNGSLTTFSSDNYIVDTDSEPGRVVLKSGESWPGDTLQIVNGVEIQFDAGYGDEASDVPEDLILAMKLMIGHWYENREDVVLGTVARSIPLGAEMLLWPYRLFMKADH